MHLIPFISIYNEYVKKFFYFYIHYIQIILIIGIFGILSIGRLKFVLIGIFILLGITLIHMMMIYIIKNKNEFYNTYINPFVHYRSFLRSINVLLITVFLTLIISNSVITLVPHHMILFSISCFILIFVKYITSYLFNNFKIKYIYTLHRNLLNTYNIRGLKLRKIENFVDNELEIHKDDIKNSNHCLSFTELLMNKFKNEYTDKR